MGQAVALKPEHSKMENVNLYKNVQITLNRQTVLAFLFLMAIISSPLLYKNAMLITACVGFTKNNYHHFGVLIPHYSKDLATGTEFESSFVYFGKMILSAICFAHLFK